MWNAERCGPAPALNKGVTRPSNCIDFILVIAAVASFATLSEGIAAEPSCSTTPVRLSAPFSVTDARSELSGVVLEGDQLFALSNEALETEEPHAGQGRKGDFVVQQFKGNVSSGYEWQRDVLLFRPGRGACAEADFEALARYGDEFFAIGSHSRNRAKQKEGSSRAKSYQRLTTKG